MGLVIAGERSGVGKTTVTLALLAALTQGNHPRECVQAFKVGPDYIDPMFHRAVTGRDSYTLDPILTNAEYVQQCYRYYSQTADYALVEGVMGLFDGVMGDQDLGSTAHVARLLNLPVLLVIDASHLSRSAAAIVHGYRTFDPRLQIAGVVLNRVGSDRHLELLTTALEGMGVPILGVIRRQAAIAIPDRHLGLVPTAELSHWRSILDQLATLGQTCFDWNKLLPLIQPSEVTQSQPPWGDHLAPIADQSAPVKIAIAQDPAFSFYYADNLKILHALGAETIPWSPMQDANLPFQINGLYLGGGFPEMFAAELSANKPMHQVLQTAILQGLPTYAECGGLMYLCESLTDLAQTTWPMVGILPTQTYMHSRLTLGYRQARALQSGLLVTQGQQVIGHEFHRSQLTQPSTQPLYTLQGYSPSAHPYCEGWQSHNLQASYLHLHWGTQIKLPQRWLKHCQSFQPQT